MKIAGVEGRRVSLLGGVSGSISTLLCVPLTEHLFEIHHQFYNELWLFLHQDV